MKTRATRIIPAVLLLLNSLGSSAWAAAYSIGYQGQLRQNGVPATGAHSVVFKIYPTETGGTPVWTGPTETVSFTNGQFFSTFTPTGVDWEGTSPVLEVSIDGTALTPREALSAIPYAFNAQLHSGKKYTTAAAAPAAAAAGDLWYDSTAAALKYFNGTAWVAPATGGGLSAVFSQSAQFSGDGSSGNPLTLLASSVTLQGNAVNVSSGLVRLDGSGRYPALDGSLITNLPSSSDRLAKAGDIMTGDLQVGGATASTFSISGFITLANLGGAPAAARGRLYFDPTGTGAFKVSLDGSTFVSLATGAVSGADDSRVLKTGDTMTGQLTNTSTITVQGNAFSVGGSTLVVVNGNVGVGTISPSARLHVSGGDTQVGDATASTISASGFITLANLGSAPSAARGRLYFDPTSAGAFKISLDGSTFVSLATGTVSGADSSRVLKAGDTMTGQLTNTSTITVQGDAFSVGGSTLVVTNGNIGIGTLDPWAKMEIVQSGALNTTTPGFTRYGLHLTPQNSTADTAAGITFGAGDAGSPKNAQTGIYSQFSGAYGTKMYLATSDSYATGAKTRMMIDHLGNIGVGTVSPGTRLDVKSAGSTATDYSQIWRDSSDVIQASMSATGVLYADGTGLRNLAAADGTKVAKTGDTMTGPLTTTSTVTIQGNAFSVGGSTLVVVNGNVGIGTTAPAARLDVQAASGAYESAVFRNPSGVAVATVTAAGVFAGTNQWSFTIYDPGGLVASDDIPSIIAARVSSATIKEVWCESDDASASINLEKYDGATTSILASDLTCGTTGSSSASFTASANALNLNNKINFLLQSIGGGAKRINVVIKYALN